MRIICFLISLSPYMLRSAKLQGKIIRPDVSNTTFAQLRYLSSEFLWLKPGINTSSFFCLFNTGNTEVRYRPKKAPNQSLTCLGEDRSNAPITASCTAQRWVTQGRAERAFCNIVTMPRAVSREQQPHKDLEIPSRQTCFISLGCFQHLSFPPGKQLRFPQDNTAR